MLSRTADHLYWMARYTERAENLARMLNVTYNMSLMPQAPQAGMQSWAGILSINELQETFNKIYSELSQDNVIRFMVLDTENPSSIMSCLRAARENARAVRGTLTPELWESLNTTWLEIRDTAAERLAGSELGDLFEWVKLRSHLSRGVAVGTMLHDEAFHFIRLGTFIERADNTARILDFKYHILLPSRDEAAGTVDYYQWGALLRSVSAFQIYRRVYRDQITPLKVAELLILRADMPRSLHACLDEIYSILSVVANKHSAETTRFAGELHASLHYGRIDNIHQRGLHNTLEDFLARIHELGNRISNDFLVPTENKLPFTHRQK